MTGSDKVIALVDDMFFASKIKGAAEQCGRSLVRVRSQEELERELNDPPRLILIDLNSTRLDPLAAITFLKSQPDTRSIPVIGFLSHVQTELVREAEQAGCDHVMPRSRFSQQLVPILSGDFAL